MPTFGRAFLMGILLAIGAPVAAETVIKGGEEVWQIVLTPTSGKFTTPYLIPDYVNASNSQKVLQADSRVIILERRVNYEALNSTFPLSGAVEYAEDPGLSSYLTPHPSAVLKEVSQRLAAGRTAQADFVTAVIYFVRDRLVWNPSNTTDAERVYNQKYGVCAGFANLACALLRNRGIPCRVAHVLTLKHPSWNAGLHAEVEVFYKDVGWVSYDPQAYNHFGPYPRLYYGNSVESVISSRDERLWEAYKFVNGMSYTVQYRPIKNTIRFLGIGEQPLKQDMISRSDGFQRERPSLHGIVYEKDGELWPGDRIYHTLKADTDSYQGLELSSGGYILANDADGGRLWLDRPGYVVFYDFPGTGTGTGTRSIHDIDFSGPETIAHKTGPSTQVKYYFQERSYYSYLSDASGLLRFHVNPQRSPVRLDRTTYVFESGAWKVK